MEGELVVSLTDVLQRLDAKKAILDKARPLPSASVRSLMEDFHLRYIHETTALEGNTLTLHETEAVLEYGITVHGKSLRDHLEVIDARNALDFFAEAIKNKEPASEKIIMQFHRMLMKGTLQEEAGFYRRIPVYIKGATHVPPNWRKVPELMAEFESWLKKATDVHPIGLAAQAHIRVARIHPFVDGNGRTCRLLVNYILMQHGYPPALYTAGNRDAYMQALEDVERGNEEPFIRITAEATEWMLDRYLNMVEEMGDDHSTTATISKMPGGRTCSIRCQSSTAPVSTCRCVCGGKNHGTKTLTARNTEPAHHEEAKK